MNSLTDIDTFTISLRHIIETCFETKYVLENGADIYPKGLTDPHGETNGIVVTAEPDRALVTVYRNGLWDTREYKKPEHFTEWNQLVADHLTPFVECTAPITAVTFYKESDGHWNFTSTLHEAKGDLDKIHQGIGSVVASKHKHDSESTDQHHTLDAISRAIHRYTTTDPKVEGPTRRGNLGLRELAFSDAKAPFGGINEFVTPRDADDDRDVGDEELSIQQDLYELQSALDVFASKHLPGGLKYSDVESFNLDYDEDLLVLRITNTNGVVTEFTKITQS